MRPARPARAPDGRFELGALALGRHLGDGLSNELHPRRAGILAVGKRLPSTASTRPRFHIS